MLEGAVRHRALSAVDSIATSLRDVASWGDPTLSGGAAGLSVLFAYLYRCQGRAWQRESARHALRSAVTGVARKPLQMGLFQGVTGVGWAVEHGIAHGVLDTDADSGEDRNVKVDQGLLTLLRRRSDDARCLFDLVSGLPGMSVYSLSRIGRKQAVQCLSVLLDRFEEKSLRTSTGITWRTDPDLGTPQKIDAVGGAYFDLGVAHGIPGVMGVLSGYVALGVRREQAQDMLEEAVNWLLAVPEPEQGGQRFPGLLGTDGQVAPARHLGWCYGDLGIATVLALASLAADRSEWREKARTIALETLGASHSYTHDAGLCHGAAGIGHLYNRLYQIFGTPELKSAAARWFDTALEFRREGGELGGFRAYQPSEAGSDYRALPGYLRGSAGIGLALAAASTPYEPAWDRPLLTAPWASDVGR